jgi:hypothetical protein
MLASSAGISELVLRLRCFNSSICSIKWLGEIFWVVMLYNHVCAEGGKAVLFFLRESDLAILRCHDRHLVLVTSVQSSNLSKLFPQLISTPFLFLELFNLGLHWHWERLNSRTMKNDSVSCFTCNLNVFIPWSSLHWDLTLPPWLSVLFSDDTSAVNREIIEKCAP